MGGRVTATAIVAKVRNRFAGRMFRVQRSGDRHPRSIPGVVRDGRAFTSNANELMFGHRGQTSRFSYLERVFFGGDVQGVRRIKDDRGQHPFFVGTRVYPRRVPVSPRGFFHFQIPCGWLLMEVLRYIMFVGVR